MRVTGSLLQTASRLLGRVMTPAVVVALAVSRPCQIGELVGEGSLAEQRPGLGERVAALYPPKVAVGHETLQVRNQRLHRHREEARELARRVGAGQPLGVHPVHGLEHLVADPERFELAHPAAATGTSSPARSSIARTNGISGSWSSGDTPARSASCIAGSKGTTPTTASSFRSANSCTASSSLSSRILFATSTTRSRPSSTASAAMRRPVSSDL